jgi:hypothetical protein
VFRTLNATGYSGPISAEWKGAGMERELGAPESLSYLRRFTFAPASAAFDARLRRHDDASADQAEPGDTSGVDQLSG